MLGYDVQKIPVSQLRVGMYVCGLDSPWEGTDYPFEGVLIETEGDIDKLLCCCKHVYIDVSKSNSRINCGVTKYYLGDHVKSSKAYKSNVIKHPSASLKTKKVSLNSGNGFFAERYETLTSVTKEIKRCEEVYSVFERQIYMLCEKTFRCRRANIEQIMDTCSQAVESIIRNPDAFAWLCKVRDTKKPVYTHIIRLAVWGGVVGRQLGLDRSALTHVCFSLLMTGIGKSRVSDEALQSYRAGNPTTEYKKHLNETLSQLREILLDDESVLNTLQNYCERLDGSGFPNKKKGNKIPFLSQVCGLIETFELLVNPFNTENAISPAKAIVCLNRAKNILFDKTLVEKFIDSIGLYPTGTLVRVSNGMLGVVHSHNDEKNSRASVIPIMNENGKTVDKLKLMDLSCSSEEEIDETQLFIVQGLPSHSVPRSLLEQAHQHIYQNNNKNGMMQRLYN